MEDAQAEVEEVRQKETRAKKFQYASITFDTFKPDTATPPHSGSVYQPESDENQQQHEKRIPSFARNFNPLLNRAELARSYEVVTPMSSRRPTATATDHVDRSFFPTEDYDKLMHQDRKMTGSFQQPQQHLPPRKFSITTSKTNKLEYAQLSLNNPQQLPPSQQQQQQQQQEEEQKKKGNDRRKATMKEPAIPPRGSMNKDSAQHLAKAHSYSMVNKTPAPPLPPRYNPDDEEERVEEHYKVPRKCTSNRALSPVEFNVYDLPSSLGMKYVTTQSCQDLEASCSAAGGRGGATSNHTHYKYEDGRALYDVPSASVTAFSQRLFEEEMMMGRRPQLSLHSLSISQDSYVDMAGNTVSYV